MAIISSISPVSSSTDPGDNSGLLRQSILNNQAGKDHAKNTGGDAQQGAGNPQPAAANGIQAGVKSQGGSASGQNIQSGSSQGSNAEQIEIQKLISIDRQVRTHEQAHLAAAGGLATSSPAYTYRSGPDGKLYAVGGEVSIDSSPVRDNPEATITKAQRVVRAALAPADPSPQDRRVAASASSMAMEARMELARQEYAKTSKSQSGASYSTQDAGA